jgi:hypothetical protein
MASMGNVYQVQASGLHAAEVLQQAKRQQTESSLHNIRLKVALYYKFLTTTKVETIVL